MGERSLRRVAAIDVGSNSTRLLVADVDVGRASRGDGEPGDGGVDHGGGVRALERQSRVTRLGRGVDLSGQLADEAIEATCAAIGDYLGICREHDVEKVAAIATSAVRDASNGAAFVAELRERFALSARVFDGEEEARLTYRGATAERPPAVSTLVIDIGGGSTEIVVGNGAEIGFHASLQAGVVRHTERHIASDPPTTAELEALAADVRGLIEASLTRPPEPSRSGAPFPLHAWERRTGTAGEGPVPVEAGIAVAGTPTSLAAVELGLEPYDPARVHGHVLSLATIQRELSRFASAPLAERAAIPGLHPDRAPTIVAGCVILVEAMRAFELDRIRVSEHDILFGTALEAAAGCG
jgi:exopolyphosphatase/guanosine-5'-triphosphate,3'-diphosphate pyrophosphatase